MFKVTRFWKRCAGWVIASTRSPFVRSQLKLTVIFAAAMIAVVIIFFQFFYRDLINYSRADFQKRFSDPAVVSERIARLDTRIKTVFFRIDPGDAITVALIIILSYLLTRQALSPVQEAIESQKHFLMDASHELRTPLSIIKAELEVALLDKKNQGKTVLQRDRTALLSNLEEVDRMSRILDELLLLARLDVHQIRLDKVVTDLGPILQELAVRMGSAEKRMVKFSQPSSRPAVVKIDRDRIRQAFANLIRNALLYSSDDVQIKMKSTKPAIEVQIIDRGIGMAPATQERVFERFYRGPEARQKAASGSGLGLAITKWIIEAHGGKISLKSQLGRGTTITVLLPAV